MFVGEGQSDGIYAEYLYLLHIRMGARKRKVFGGRSGLVIKRGARNRTEPRRTQQIILSSQLKIHSLNHVTKVMSARAEDKAMVNSGGGKYELNPFAGL